MIMDMAFFIVYIGFEEAKFNIWLISVKFEDIKNAFEY